MDVAITKMSSKGQVVIPSAMRKNFKEGERIFLIQEGGRLIMKKIGDLEKNLESDLIFAKRTEEALKRYEAGLFKEKPDEKFLKDLKEW